MKKFTPGPWEILQADTRRVQIEDRLVEATGAMLIGHYGKRLTFEGFEIGEEEFLANLSLVAAAPELLEALEVAVAEIVAWRNGANTKAGLKSLNDARVGCCFGGLTAARAALAKALGKKEMAA